jgi:hypothetical protein
MTGDLTWLDPESEECLEAMIQIISAEVSARLSVGDSDIRDPAWVARIGSLAADALLDRFEVRERPEGRPRIRLD